MLMADPAGFAAFLLALGFIALCAIYELISHFTAE